MWLKGQRSIEKIDNNQYMSGFKRPEFKNAGFEKQSIIE